MGKKALLILDTETLLLDIQKTDGELDKAVLVQRISRTDLTPQPSQGPIKIKRKKKSVPVNGNPLTFYHKFGKKEECQHYARKLYEILVSEKALRDVPLSATIRRVFPEISTSSHHNKQLAIGAHGVTLGLWEARMGLHPTQKRSMWMLDIK